MDKTVVELFAGVGGFRLGLQNADDEYRVEWANQWEPSRKNQEAFDCYTKHFQDYGIHSNKDINEVDIKSDVPKHTLLVGGFPCQDYSVAATGAKGIQGKKGVLWWNIYKILEIKKPPFVLLENVDRLLRSPSAQRGRDFSVILACLQKLNYSVEWRVINAAEYGFAQRRRRIFIFAFRNNSQYKKSLKNFSTEEVLLEGGFFQDVFQSTIDLKKTKLRSKRKLASGNKRKITTMQEIKEISDEMSFHYLNAGCLVGNTLETIAVTPVYKGKHNLLENIVKTTNEKKYYLGEDLSKWITMKGAKKIKRTHRDGHEYTFSEGKIAFPDPLDRPARTMLTSESSSNRSTHIIEDPKTENLRKLTPEECEQLNGFPAGWTKDVKPESFRYFCMGNALVVDLIEIMGKKLSEIIEEE